VEICGVFIPVIVIFAILKFLASGGGQMLSGKPKPPPSTLNRPAFTPTYNNQFSTPRYRRRKSRLPIVLGILVVLGAAIFFLPRLLSSNDSSRTVVTNESSNHNAFIDETSFVALGQVVIGRSTMDLGLASLPMNWHEARPHPKTQYLMILTNKQSAKG